MNMHECVHTGLNVGERQTDKTLQFIPKVDLLVLYPVPQLGTYLLSQNKDSIIKWLASWA